MNENEVAYEAEELRRKYLALQKEKTKLRFQIPQKLRFPLVWTLFFSMLGIMIQSIQRKTLVGVEFFTSRYLDWFASFGSFAQTYQIGMRDLLYALLKGWYYFFITGGLIALLWAILYSLIHAEIRVEKKDLPI